ncbi:MAG: hypothetical protein U9Q92_02200 [archaeon]|nr:hypothetical protein [archaeon]
MKFDRVFIIAVLLLCLFAPCSLALTVNTEKVDYVIGDTINVDGTAGFTAENVNISVYNSTDNLMSSSVVNTTGGATNYYSCSIQINSNYTPGNYYLSVNDGTGTVTSALSVLSEFLSLKSHLIKNPSVKPIHTTYLVTGPGNYSSDFSDIFNLSISGTLHYGNISDLTGDGKNYSFALVDEKASSVYDMVYIDKNNTFSGIWKARHVGEKISADVNYTITDIEFSTGNMILLAPPIEDDSYSAGETVHLLVWTKNETHMKAGTDVNISVVDKNDNIKNATTGQTNSDGYLVTNFTAPADVGVYFVKVNDMPTEVFTVETFKLVGKITDLSGNPMFSFSENPKLKIVAKVKDASGNIIDSASVSAKILSPGGSTASQGTLTFDNNTNDYMKEVDLSSVSANGEYKVIITAEYGDTQEFVTSFAIESVKLDVMAINPLFIEDAKGPEAMVDAFAPESNVSLMVVLSNASSGNIMECGPEEMGLIDIDNKSTAVDECETRVTLISLRDEKGTEQNLSALNYQIMNLSRAVQFLGAGNDDGPEDEMLSQCMILFEAPNKTGVYKAEVKLKHPAGEKKAVSTFSLQRVYATANPVDFKGDDFWFYAPNSSIKIKIKVTDLLTRGDVPGENITDAKIIEMYKVWPAFEDVLDGSYDPNASAANGTITFTSPDSEGFFMFKFKFKADVGGTEEYGTGNGFFMLKKYMIWGEPSGCEPGQACITAHGEPIKLTINVVDIEKGSMMDLGKSGLSCSDNDNDGLPDCDGLEVNVDEIWNEQLMKKMENGTNYDVNTTSIRSSTANLVISPVDMPTGWYHVDLVLTDPVTGDTYFGWAWFEIRNFWVDVMTIESDEEGNLSAGWERGGTYGIGDSVLFTAMAFDPKNKTEYGPKLLEISTVSLESLSMMRHNGPPVILESGTDYIHTISNKDVSMPWGPPEAEPEQMKVVNLTLKVNKTGEYIANIRVTTTEGDSDIGDMWFDVSKFRVEMTHNGGEEEWCTTFSPTQVVEINITASDFDENPVNLSQNATKIRTFWSEKSMHPIKPPANSTTVTCTGNKCTLTANLSMILSGKGKYDLEMDIVDINGNKKQSSIFFETRGIIVSIPAIKEIWFHEQDTNKRELDINNDHDRCNNERGLDWDQYSGSGGVTKPLDPENGDGAGGLQPDDCVGSATDVCIYGNLTNFTGLASKVGSFRANTYCLLNNGTITALQFCGPSNGSNIGLLTNETHLWINDSFTEPVKIHMSGIPSRVNGDTFTVGARNWTIINVFVGDQYGNRTEYRDDRIVRSCGGGECVNLIVSPKNISLTYHVNPFCVNETWPDAPQLGCSGNQKQVFVVSDTEQVWVGNTTNMTLSVPKADGEALAGFVGSGNWRVLDVGKNPDGSSNSNAVRIVPNWTYYVMDVSNTPPINVSRKYTKNFGRAFCIRPDGEWNDGDGSCQQGETVVFVVSNTSHLWINTTADLTESSTLAVDSEFEVSGVTWTVVSVDWQQFRVKRASGICGEKMCDQGGCVGYVMTTPPNHLNYSTVYHAYVRNMIGNLQWQNEWFEEHFPAFNETRDVYVYHNTTHVWMSDSSNLSTETAYGVGDSVDDPYGGKWKVDSINRNNVILRGENVLASTGAFINMSLSKSGVVKVTAMEERHLGGWDKESGEEVGIDINDDGETNSTVYFALTDSQNEGVYDTLFYSSDNNFSEAISVNGDRAERTFGEGVNLTLLSISPDARRVLAYGQKTGDWGDLGELKVGTNVSIPVIVRAPSGQYALANVSLVLIRAKTGSTEEVYENLQLNKTINGIDEIEVSLEDTINSSGSGRYVFGLAAESEDSEKELMEEWMWPFITMRSFLADAHIGDGGYISGFKQLPLANYKEHNYGWIPDVRYQYVDEVDKSFALLANARCHEMDPSNCNFEKPADADQTADNWTLNMLQPWDYWLYINAGNESKVWIKKGDCNYSAGAELKSTGDAVNITLTGNTYMLYVLDVNVTHENSKGVVIGPAGVNSSIIEPVRYDGSNPQWRIMSLNVSGQLYGVLLANDTTQDYPMCSVWNIDECTKKAWFDTDGNFSDADGVSIGENFTKDLYLARVGPGPWEGVSIGNYSDILSLNLGALGIDVEVMDNTQSLFALVNESEIGLDLNQNNERNDTFYMVVSDDRYDEVNDLTTVTIDDDLQITQEWWQKDESCYDFYGDEAEAIRESRGNLPNSIWSGNVRFGEEINDSNPNWQIETFDGTSMLLRKDRHWENPFNISENVTVVLRAYNFNQSAVGGANLSVERVMSFGFMGGSILIQGSDYGISITNNNQTYADGYAIVTLYPIGGDWDKGEHMVQVNIKDGSVTERKTEWFRIGDKMF